MDDYPGGYSIYTRSRSHGMIDLNSNHRNCVGHYSEGNHTTLDSWSGESEKEDLISSDMVQMYSSYSSIYLQEIRDINSYPEDNLEEWDQQYHKIQKRKGGRPRSKTPTEDVLRSRRRAANARERKRMDRMNAAYVRLRQVLPGSQNIISKKRQSIKLYNTLLIWKDC